MSGVAVTALVLALVLSLAMNLVLSVRLDDERRRVAGYAGQVEELQRTVERLREGLRAGSGDDPLTAIASAVERLRGLRFRADVEAEVLTKPQLERRVRRAFLRDNPRSELERTARVLETLGVIPDGYDLFRAFLRVQTEQVAGYYDSDTKKLVVSASDTTDPAPGDRVILAHEYTHALTDQHFDLSRLERMQDRGDDDRAAAYLALIEGDAVVVMTDYFGNVLTPGEQVEFSQQEIETGELDRLPEFLRRSILYPYFEGRDFAQGLRDRGGTDLVDSAYGDPPDSTEQILHPEKYVDRRDRPTEVVVPDVRAALGSGWRALQRGGVGELDLRLIADVPAASQGLPERDANAAAAGWDGGRYAAFGSGADTLVAVLTAWDSDSQARQAEDLLGTWLPLRYGNRGANHDVGAHGRGWTAPDGAGMVVRNADRVLMILGPSTGDIEAARGAFDGF